MENKTDYLWQDRKRPIFGMPLSFTKYSLTNDKLIISSGMFNVKEEEIRLYRILDLSLNKSFFQRIFGVGNIHVGSADKSSPDFEIRKVKRPGEVKNLLSNAVESSRNKNSISSKEFLSGDMEE